MFGISDTDPYTTLGIWGQGTPDPPRKPTPVFSRAGIDWNAYGRYGPYDSPSILYVLVQLARAAYSLDPDIWTTVALACQFDEAGLVPHSDEHGKPGAVYWRKNGAGSVIMCRGTTRLSQWLSYADVDQVAADGVAGKCFRAFMLPAITQPNALYGDVFNYQAARPNPECLIVGGHSLGGAVMRIIHQRLGKRASGVAVSAAVVTFGCPRVGNSDFAYYKYDNPHVRVCRDDDGVTDVPPPIFYQKTLGGLGPALLATYRHGQGIRVLLHDDAPPERGEAENPAVGQTLGALKGAASLGIADGGHALVKYSAALRKHATVLREADWGSRIFGLDDTLNGLGL
jgi:hypothetical protein